MVGDQATLQVTLSSAAGSNGVLVMLHVADTSKANFGPGGGDVNVNIPSGSTTGTFKVNGVALGSTTITASATGLTSADHDPSGHFGI